MVMIKSVGLVQGDIGRYREIRGDTRRYREMRGGGTGSDREMREVQGDTGEIQGCRRRYRPSPSASPSPNVALICPSKTTAPE